MKLAGAPRVILRQCATYDAGAIRAILREGLLELGLKPFGRTLVKPNLVIAGPRYPHAHTRPELAEGVLRALQDVGGAAMAELAVGERCGITVPTRSAFAQSGFEDMVRRVPGVKKYCFEECRQVQIPLTHAGRLRDYVFTPEPSMAGDSAGAEKARRPWEDASIGERYLRRILLHAVPETATRPEARSRNVAGSGTGAVTTRIQSPGSVTSMLLLIWLGAMIAYPSSGPRPVPLLPSRPRAA